jgi:hypothetical protein
MSQTTKVSLILQDLASHISTTLEAAAGEPIAFVLVMQTDGVAQYVANMKRGEGVLLLESLFERWKAGRADIPAHYNPDLPKDRLPCGHEASAMLHSTETSKPLYCGHCDNASGRRDAEAMEMELRADLDKRNADLARAKALLVKLHDRFPDARSLIEGHTGGWFVWGVDRGATPPAAGDEMTEPRV